MKFVLRLKIVEAILRDQEDFAGSYVSQRKICRNFAPSKSQFKLGM